MISLFTLKKFSEFPYAHLFSYKKGKIKSVECIQCFYDIAYRYEIISIRCFYQLDTLNLCKNGL